MGDGNQPRVSSRSLISDYYKLLASIDSPRAHLKQMRESNPALSSMLYLTADFGVIKLLGNIGIDHFCSGDVCLSRIGITLLL